VIDGVIFTSDSKGTLFSMTSFQCLPDTIDPRSAKKG